MTATSPFSFPVPMAGENTQCLLEGLLGVLPVPPSPSRLNSAGLGGHPLFHHATVCPGGAQ